MRVSALALSDLLGVLDWLCTVQLSKRRSALTIEMPAEVAGQPVWHVQDSCKPRGLEETMWLALALRRMSVGECQPQSMSVHASTLPVQPVASVLL